MAALLANHGALTRANPGPTASATGTAPGPVTVAAPPPSAAATRGCPPVIANLPVALSGRHSRPAQSASPYVAAWGEPPIVLRCGVPRPAAFVQASHVSIVNGVQWLAEPRPGSTLWTVVDREVYVEVAVPTGEPNSVVVDLSTVIVHALPERKPRPAHG